MVLVEETEVEAYHDLRGDYHDRERGGCEDWERDGWRCMFISKLLLLLLSSSKSINSGISGPTG